MRTTLRIDDGLMSLVRNVAVQKHCSMGKVVEDALRQILTGTTAGKGKRKRIELPEKGSGGLQPGIDMDSAADLLFVMEEKDDSYGR